MYIDSRELVSDKDVEAEICVIGAGAAGITLAQEWSNKPFRVCLLESGGLEFDLETHELASAINVGRKYPLLEASRLRFFGGSTNHWGGHCVPIRPLNFEYRDWIPYSGWPISRRDLDPYYKRAHRILRLGEFEYDAPVMADSMEMELFPFDSTRVESVVSRYNPFRFNAEYRKVLEDSANIDTYLYANVVSINQHPDADYIQNVRVKTLAGNSFSVRAKYFVLATGGIDNARLLLLSNQVQKNGLGNERDLVGRFFMEHIYYPSGAILPAEQDELLEIYLHQHPFVDPYDIRCHIALPESVIKKQRIPDFRSEIAIKKLEPDSVYSARLIRDSLTDFEIPDAFAEHVFNTMGGAGTLLGRKMGASEIEWLQGYLLVNYVEQVPNPASRIGLSYEKDKLGLNRATVDWRLSELDKAGIVKAHRLIASEVGRSGFGRMRIELLEDEEMILEGADGGAHHMGTTRMNNSPEKGVVDAHCRIHGLNNIFVCGSSVFPTCGYSNPTLTIVALSVRLADNLSNIMKKEKVA